MNDAADELVQQAVDPRCQHVLSLAVRQRADAEEKFGHGDAGEKQRLVDLRIEPGITVTVHLVDASAKWATSAARRRLSALAP